MYTQHSASHSDEELWSELRAGKQAALHTLFLRHHDSLFRYGLAICADKPVIQDCLQDLFFQLWKTHADLSEVRKVKGYLWISFRRLLFKRLAKNPGSRGRSSQLRPAMKKASSFERQLIQEEIKADTLKALDTALEELTRREREVLFLKYYDGMSYSEIGQILDIEYQTARNYMHRAINRLREVLLQRGTDILLIICALLLL